MHSSATVSDGVLKLFHAILGRMELKSVPLKSRWRLNSSWTEHLSKTGKKSRGDRQHRPSEKFGIAFNEDFRPQPPASPTAMTLS